MNTYPSLSEIQSQLLRKELTIAELVDQYLGKIEATKDLNIYVDVYRSEIRDQAIILDQKIQSGDHLGKLFGCIVSVKDVIVQKGQNVTAGSKILEGYTSPYNATAIQRLLDEDALIIGRTNCDEFGMGSSNENSIYGPTKNGIAPDRVPGGSSGGAAVSVQVDTCTIALGSDTGGSVRQPATFCGVYGLKPTYGRISRYGLIAYASSFDQIGILSKDVDAIGIALEVMAGDDPMDATSSKTPVHPYHDFADDLSKSSIAILPSLINQNKIDKSIVANFEKLIGSLSSSGWYIGQAEFSLVDYLVPTYYVLTPAEASTNLSRYDGVRYGYRSHQSDTLEDMYVNTRTVGFGKEVKRRIALGTYVLSEGYFDAYFTKAQKVRRLIKEEVDNLLESHDFILLPTSTSLPWKIGEKSDDPVSVYLSDVYTVLANLTGLPAISIPTGTNKDGIPFGVQLLSKKYSEYHLLKMAKKINSIIQ